jgi:hypothetical protein
MLDLTDEETDALARLLSRTIDDDRYPLSPIPAHSDLEGDRRQNPAGADTRAVAAARALRAAASRREKTMLATANLPFSPVLRAGGGDRLPLHVRNRIGDRRRRARSALMPNDPNEQSREDCRAEDDPECGFR